MAARLAPTAPSGPRSRAAALSIGSNAALIVLKLVAGAATGSVAILTEAIHSGVDLLASLVAYFSVRGAEQPADADHRYGHEKFENVAAGVEGMLILAGSGVIIFTAVRQLLGEHELEHIGFGMSIVVLSTVVNLVVSTYLFRRATELRSPALAGDAAHLRVDAYTSLGVVAALALVHLTGATWIDPAVGLVIAVAIVVTGVRIMRQSWRVLVDEALPASELGDIHAAISPFAARGVVGYHQLRTRQAGARRYVDLHLQFKPGTSLEEAHLTGHEVQDAICERLQDADVLIHLEPGDRVRHDGELEQFAVGESAHGGIVKAGGVVNSLEIDSRRHGQREHYAEVSEITGNEQDHAGHEADRGRDDPGGSSQRHGS